MRRTFLLFAHTLQQSSFDARSNTKRTPHRRAEEKTLENRVRRPILCVTSLYICRSEDSPEHRMEGIVHSNSAFNFESVSGPDNKEIVPFSISACRRSTS